LTLLQIDDVGVTSPIDLAVCTWLRCLTINADIDQIPLAIGLLTDLDMLDLGNNRLTSIDSIDFALVSKLTELRVSKRPFDLLFLTFQRTIVRCPKIDLGHRYETIGKMRRR
jgi:Leucine-rich repeat (LRR) protein